MVSQQGRLQWDNSQGGMCAWIGGDEVGGISRVVLLKVWVENWLKDGEGQL